jgi:esterase/lipase superfamily enzyme
MILGLLILFASGGLSAQLEVPFHGTTVKRGPNDVIFFTNRKPKNTGDGSLDFRNRWTRQTKSLHFCIYHYDNDSISLRSRIHKTTEKKEFPAGPVEENIFYDIYEDLRIDRGIRYINIVIPGFGKTFDNQMQSFVYRFNKFYGDALAHNTVFLSFAWGDQSIPLFYYKGKRSANRAANDFAIFQHMLEEFLHDSAYFATHPNDVRWKLICTSMGNQLLKRYMIKREKQGIPFQPTYNWTVFIGSDAGNDSFEKGKGFDKLHLMSDSTLVVVNRKDGPLRFSQWMNMKTRMGLSGPRLAEDVPSNVIVWDVTDAIGWEDLPALGHDYTLKNSYLIDKMLKMQSRYYDSSEEP